MQPLSKNRFRAATAVVDVASNTIPVFSSGERSQHEAYEAPLPNLPWFALKNKQFYNCTNINNTQICSLRQHYSDCRNLFAFPEEVQWIAGAHHSLSGLEIRRYSRQLLLPSFGVEAQQKLAKASVLVVGAGGLGSPVLLYLAASGVGCLGIMDPDSVELHNLHRQVIHSEAFKFVGELKVKSAAATCLAINSSL